MQHKWEVVASDRPIDPALVREIAAEIHLPEIVAKILVSRGMDTPRAAHLFFSAKTEDLYDPFLMLDMERAVERVVRALNIIWRL